jgi:hypothetical protein
MSSVLVSFRLLTIPSLPASLVSVRHANLVIGLIAGLRLI